MPALLPAIDFAVSRPTSLRDFSEAEFFCSTTRDRFGILNAELREHALIPIRSFIRIHSSWTRTGRRSLCLRISCDPSGFSPAAFGLEFREFPEEQY